MNKKLILNADGYGLDDDTNDAILLLANNHSITSTSILSNKVDLLDLEKIKHSGISTGIHLNLTLGKPISNISEVSSLLNEQGEFFSPAKLLFGYVSGKIKTKEIELEIVNQILYLESKQVNISHVDCCDHIHQYPMVGPLILKTLKRKGILKVRNCNPVFGSFYKKAAVKIFYSSTNLDLLSFNYPDGLVTKLPLSVEEYFSFFVKLKKALDKYDIIEIKTFPSLSEQPAFAERKAEYNFLLNHFYLFKKLLRDITIINYSNL